MPAQSLIGYGNARHRAAASARRSVDRCGYTARQIQLGLMRIVCAAHAAGSLARYSVDDADARTASLLEVLAFQLDALAALADDLASPESSAGAADWLVGQAFSPAGENEREG